MSARREGWLDQGGLNLIRVVLGSYFCAVAAGVPVPYDLHILFKLAMSDEMAELVGPAVLLALAIPFVLGVMLRPVSLFLAAFMILSAVVEVVIGAGTVALGVIWQSIAFGVAIMLCYGPVKPHEIHKAALISTVSMRGGAARVLQKDVAPRRVTPRRHISKQRSDDLPRALGPLIAPTERMIGIGQANGADCKAKDPRRPEPMPVIEDDPVNIFLNL